MTELKLKFYTMDEKKPVSTSKRNKSGNMINTRFVVETNDDFLFPAMFENGEQGPGRFRYFSNKQTVKNVVRWAELPQSLGGEK